jgi:hypothetical protein
VRRAYHGDFPRHLDLRAAIEADRGQPLRHLHARLRRGLRDDHRLAHHRRQIGRPRPQRETRDLQRERLAVPRRQPAGRQHQHRGPLELPDGDRRTGGTGQQLAAREDREVTAAPQRRGLVGVRSTSCGDSEDDGEQRERAAEHGGNTACAPVGAAGRHRQRGRRA